MWINVAIPVAAAQADPLSDALMEQGALSVSVEDAHLGTDQETPQFGEPGSPTTPLWDHSKVLALFEPGDDLHARVAAACRAIGIEVVPELEITEVAEQNWVQLTQAQFEPIRVTDRLWIVPSWHMEKFQPGAEGGEGIGANLPADACLLQLDPGMAFGTGSHPTTFLCLQWLCDVLQDAKADADLSLLDYGCGSGILAIAAARLGAGRVLGVDIDAKALEAAAYNAETNGVTLALQHSSKPLQAQFDIVVANILTNPLCVLAPLLSGRVRPGGKLVLSGVLESQAQQVIDAYAPYLPLHVGATLDGWCRLEGSGPAAP